MKYVLLFCGTREQQQAWEEMSEREQARSSALRALELTRNRAEQSLLARRLLEW